MRVSVVISYTDRCDELVNLRYAFARTFSMAELHLGHGLVFFLAHESKRWSASPFSRFHFWYCLHDASACHYTHTY